MGQLSEKRTVARRCLIWGLLIMALYMGWRNSIYGALPLDVYSWVQRDTLMNGPRIIGILGLLAVCAQYWGWREMGLTFAEPKKGVGYGLLMVGVWFIDHLMGASFYGYHLNSLIILTVSSFIVALFEEILFRGILLKALSDLWGSRVGIWVSTALFTVYHLEAQPLPTWGMISLAGAYLACMRAGGIGLGWCILAHGVYDSLVFLGTYGEAIYPWIPPTLLLMKLGVVMALYCRVVGQGQVDEV